jgi:hypothetical protein
MLWTFNSLHVAMSHLAGERLGYTQQPMGSLSIRSISPRWSDVEEPHRHNNTTRHHHPFLVHANLPITGTRVSIFGPFFNVRWTCPRTFIGRRYDILFN